MRNFVAVRTIAALVLVATALFTQGCASSEDAVEVEKAAVRLNDSAVVALTSYQDWSAITRSSLAGDVLGGTEEKQLDTVAGQIAEKKVEAIGPALVRDKLERILSPKKSEATAATRLADAAGEVRKAVRDLREAGPFFAPQREAARLKPILERLASSALNVADVMKRVEPVKAQLAYSGAALQLVEIAKSNLSPELKRTQMALVLAQAVAEIRRVQKVRDDAAGAFVVVAGYAVDMVAKIEDYEHLDLDEILPLARELAPTVAALSLGNVTEAQITDGIQAVVDFAKEHDISLEFKPTSDGEASNG